MKACVFPGQGSQKVGMGKSLFAKFPDEVAIADDILGYSIVELCLQDTKEQLNQTDFTQPALFVVEALAYLEYRAEHPAPDYLAGHSLGEYSALFAAGVFDFATGCRLVKERGRLMAAQSTGGMMAVIGVDEATLVKVLTENELTDIDVANFNSAQQIVLSGDITRLEQCQQALADIAKKCVMLNVSAAFHSRHMLDASEQFRQFLAGFSFEPLQVPVIANTTAEPYQFEQIKETLAAQIASPVRWLQSVQYLKKLGVNEFVECGPGKVLTGLIKRI